MFAQIKSYFADYKLYRSTLAELNGLSDRDLTDLSISRADIGRIAHEAVWAAQPSATAAKPLRNRRAFA